MSNQTTVILVHGAFADRHAFDLAAPLLESAGYRVLAPNLPGHGEDGTPVRDITLDTYVDAVANLVAAQEAPVVLVGHSMAGMVVSAVAERLPERIRHLIYVAAYLPQTGQNLSQLAQLDPASLVGQNMEFAVDYSTVTIRREQLANAICADVPASIQAMIVAGHKPEPLAPFQGVVNLTPERFGSIKKSYLLTTADCAVTAELQRRMLAHYPETAIADIHTSHLPFVSQPAEFTAALRRFLE